MEKENVLKARMNVNLDKFRTLQGEQTRLIKEYMDEVKSVFTDRLIETEDGGYILEGKEGDMREIEDYFYIHVEKWGGVLECVKMIGMTADSTYPNTYLVWYLDDEYEVQTCYFNDVATYSYSEILALLTTHKPYEIQYLEEEFFGWEEDN